MEVIQFIFFNSRLNHAGHAVLEAEQVDVGADALPRLVAVDDDLVEGRAVGSQGPEIPGDPGGPVRKAEAVCLVRSLRQARAGGGGELRAPRSSELRTPSSRRIKFQGICSSIRKIT